MKIVGPEIGDALQLAAAQQSYFGTAPLDEILAAELLDRPVHVNDRKPARLGEVPLRER